MLKRWRFSTEDLRIQQSSCSETVPPGVAKRYPDRSWLTHRKDQHRN